MKKKSNSEKLYRLKKDISSPEFEIKAGTDKTAKGWDEIRSDDNLYVLLSKVDDNDILELYPDWFEEVLDYSEWTFGRQVECVEEVIYRTVGNKYLITKNTGKYVTISDDDGDTLQFDHDELKSFKLVE